jgi:FAD binding domain
MASLTIDQLREQVRGAIVVVGDETYDQARAVYNAMIDRRPRVVVRAVNAGDVIASVRYAADNNLDLAIRGGGHSVPGFGTCDDGVVIDLMRMRGVRVDPASKTARAEGGATWGDFNAATHAFGLATTGGIISTTGVAGLTLGGGIGYLSRGCGLSIDNLVSAENEDLFWANRGGGGNFGVLTSLEFALHPIKDIYGGPMFFELKDGPALLSFYSQCSSRTLTNASVASRPFKSRHPCPSSLRSAMASPSLPSSPAGRARSTRARRRFNRSAMWRHASPRALAQCHTQR